MPAANDDSGASGGLQAALDALTDPRPMTFAERVAHRQRVAAQRARDEARRQRRADMFDPDPKDAA